MDYDGSRNNLLEIKSDSGLACFLYIAKDDNAMKYPLIITYDEVPLEDINMSTVSFGPIDSSSLGRGSGTYVLDVSSSYKCSGSIRTFEVASSSHKVRSSIVSSILTPTFNNSPNFDDVEGYLVDSNNLDELKEKYMFADKKMLQKALEFICNEEEF
ncbi:hypothetical protein TorRG33x02_235340 [Trema orientale]|uniref:Uncharacterized protein n=1 Tax=Trema orientale TaxID=63057 RepID=A0A2P5E207_TREOI|nr:hypothetical protein TorRG33x02_235340 [Trema orientale]